jgi:replicative DNA helicase
MLTNTHDNEMESTAVTHIGDNESNLAGIPSGYPDLDEIIGGFQKSDLIVIASRPGIGKTSLANNIAWNAAVRESLNVLYFSQELNSDQIAKRFIALDNEQKQQVPKNLVIIDYLHNVMDVMDECQRWNVKTGVDMIIIDYFQLLDFCGRIDNLKPVRCFARYLKQMARAIECPVIVLSQLNRALESRECKRPRISDLREAGFLTEYADLILFLYKDDYYYLDTEEKDICEVIVAKKKNGSTGTAKLLWCEQYLKFDSIGKKGVQI